MKRYLLLLLLAGCAVDHYEVAPGGNGSTEKMHDDLMDCKHEAWHAYYASRPNTDGVAGAAGVLGGAIGGAIVGLATVSATPDTAMKTRDINPYIIKCMERKGYEGTSEN